MSNVPFKKSTWLDLAGAVLMIFCFVVVIHLMVLVTTGCSQGSAEPKASPLPEQFAQPVSIAKLEWNKPQFPVREAWTKHLLGLIEKDLFDQMSQAKDLKRFCPRFESLSRSRQVQVIGSIVVATAYYESNWNPLSRMMEPQSSFPKPDAVTGRPVYSEGLLQLSYQDQRWHKFCKFNWAKDKLLDPKSPQKTILNPINNLDCGTRIMARQISQRGTFVVKTKYYWSVLQEGGRWSKVPEIVGRVRSFTKSFCE